MKYKFFEIPLTLKKSAGNSSMKVGGLASGFLRDLDGEAIAPEAIKEAIPDFMAGRGPDGKKGGPICLNHNFYEQFLKQAISSLGLPKEEQFKLVSAITLPLGRVTKMEVDDRGCTHWEGELSKANPIARIIYDQLQEGTISLGVSLGGKIYSVASGKDQMGQPCTIINKIRIDELSVCSNPAYRLVGGEDESNGAYIQALSKSAARSLRKMPAFFPQPDHQNEDEPEHTHDGVPFRGRFFDPINKQDITNKVYGGIDIDFRHSNRGKAMTGDDEVHSSEYHSLQSKEHGQKWMFNRLAGEGAKGGRRFKWVDESHPYSENRHLVAVNAGSSGEQGRSGTHYYAMRVSTPEEHPVMLKRNNPYRMSSGQTLRNQKGEPKLNNPFLKPETRGKLHFGKEVGTIQIGKKQHPVYEHIHIAHPSEQVTHLNKEAKPWNKKNPKQKKGKLTAAQKKKAKARAAKNNRPYPNWIDNAWAMKKSEKVEVFLAKALDDTQYFESDQGNKKQGKGKIKADGSNPKTGLGEKQPKANKLEGKSGREPKTDVFGMSVKELTRELTKCTEMSVEELGSPQTVQLMGDAAHGLAGVTNDPPPELVNFAKFLQYFSQFAGGLSKMASQYQRNGTADAMKKDLSKALVDFKEKIGEDLKGVPLRPPGSPGVTSQHIEFPQQYLTY